MAYIPGDYWISCDLCGRRYRSSTMRKNWKGQMVCIHDFESRHPQEYVRGVQDHMTVPISRPWGPNVFLNESITNISGSDNPQTTTEQVTQQPDTPSITSAGALDFPVTCGPPRDLIVDSNNDILFDDSGNAIILDLGE